MIAAPRIPLIYGPICGEAEARKVEIVGVVRAGVAGDGAGGSAAAAAAAVRVASV